MNNVYRKGSLLCCLKSSCITYIMCSIPTYPVNMPTFDCIIYTYLKRKPSLTCLEKQGGSFYRLHASYMRIYIRMQSLLSYLKYKEYYVWNYSVDGVRRFFPPAHATSSKRLNFLARSISVFRSSSLLHHPSCVTQGRWIGSYFSGVARYAAVVV